MAKIKFDTSKAKLIAADYGEDDCGWHFSKKLYKMKNGRLFFIEEAYLGFSFKHYHAEKYLTTKDNAKEFLAKNAMEA